jgi:DNA polymerase I-like protein with 3'-5' exonuclease and polymerase domains
MTLVPTQHLTPKSIALLPASDRLQIYNGLDCCVTLEVFHEISKQFNAPPETYDFERALQGPYMEIMLRGFRVDRIARDNAVMGLKTRIEKLQARLDLMALAVWDKTLNPRSPKQMKEFFYGAMKYPEVKIGVKGEWKISTNREALEKLENEYLHARPFVNAILSIRDLSKQLSVFETDIDADSRFRTSYNIAGTETGRPSSSENAFGTGGNAQNIAPSLRYVFISDPGYKLINVDLEQVEARDVGFICGCLFDDWTFLDSCESGDLHTSNARLIWPNKLPWTGDIKHDRVLAETEFYRGFSHRDMAKRGSHLSNYAGTAYTAARHLKVPQSIMEEFQARYCRGRVGDSVKRIDEIIPAFPAIPRYWQWVATELQTSHQLSNLFGRRRHFFGRPNDDATLREGIAFLPQSTTADRMNLGLWRVWRYMKDVQLLAQTHDSITFQIREDLPIDDLIAEVLERIRVELKAPSGRSYIVPGEASTGWNWGKMSDTNPDGLRKWKPGEDNRERTQLLQRMMPG